MVKRMLLHIAPLFLLACTEGDIAGLEEGGSKAGAVKKDSIDWSKPTEIYKGVTDAGNVVFSQISYTTYRLVENGKEQSGSLNTERGYGDEHDATVYVLNYDKPVSQQRYFARLNNGVMYMLDRDRAVLDDAILYKVADASASPTIDVAPAEPVEHPHRAVAAAKVKSKAAEKSAEVKRARATRPHAASRQHRPAARRKAAAAAPAAHPHRAVAAKKVKTSAGRKAAVAKNARANKAARKKARAHHRRKRSAHQEQKAAETK